MKETTTVSKTLAAILVTSQILCICDKFSMPNKGTKVNLHKSLQIVIKHTFITKFYIHSISLSSFNVKEVIDKKSITQNNSM